MIIDVHSHVGNWVPGSWHPPRPPQVAGWVRTFYDLIELPREEFLEHHLRAASEVDRMVVFAIARGDATALNDEVADYVARHPDKFIGFASVDPTVHGAVAEAERAITRLGLRGLKMSPVYQHYDPTDRDRLYPIYEMAQAQDVPILVHQATTYYQFANLTDAQPYRFDRALRDFPRLTLILAHMGAPWYAECAALVRKHPRAYADISSNFHRPWTWYQALLTFYEWGVMDKLVLATDFPVITPAAQIEHLFKANAIPRAAGLPTIPEAALERIVSRNAEEALAPIL
ncbi:MAG: amidohydrolase [Armatimonadetes bacterium]|nr:amidohydrolase [Armatimonadota bacterium]